MATVYYPSFDVISVDANGYRVVVASTTLNVYNVTAAASLGTVAVNANGIVPAGSFTATAKDVVEFSHATYPLTFRLTLQENQELAYTAVENDISTYVVQDLYAPTTTSNLVDLYVQDTDNPDVPIQKIGGGEAGTDIKIPYQTAIPKNLKIFPVARDENFNFEKTNFDTDNFVELAVPAVSNAFSAEPYRLDAYSGVLEDAVAAIQASPAGEGQLWITSVYTRATNYTIPADVKVTLHGNGKIRPTAGAVVTILSGAPPSGHVFDGADGDVVYGRGALGGHPIDQAWWTGIQGYDGGAGPTDQTHAFSQFFQSLENQGADGGGKGVAPPGEFRFKDLQLPRYTHIEGGGFDPNAGSFGAGTVNGTVWKIAAGGTTHLLEIHPQARMCKLSGMALSTDGIAGKKCLKWTGSGANSAFFLDLDRCAFQGDDARGNRATDWSVEINGSGTTEFIGISITNCWFQVGENQNGLYMNSVNTSPNLNGTTFQCAKDAIGQKLVKCGWFTGINQDFRGVNTYNYTTTTNRTITSATITDCPINTTYGLVTLNTGSLTPNDLHMRLQWAGFEGYITRIISSTQCWIHQKPGTPITAQPCTVEYWDDFADTAYACIEITGDHRSYLWLGGASEGFNYDIVVNGNLTDGISLLGVKAQGRCKINGNANIYVGANSVIPSCWIEDHTVGPAVLVNIDKSVTVTARTGHPDIYLFKGEPIGKWANSGVVPTTRLQYDRSTKERFADNLAAIGSYNNTHLVRQNVRMERSEWNDPDTGLAEPLLALTDTTRRQGGGDPQAAMLQWDVRDVFGNIIHKITAGRNDSTGALDVLGSQTGTFFLNLNGTIQVSTFTAGGIAYPGTGGKFEQQPTLFFWDRTNSRLHIGGNSPARRLALFDVAGQNYQARIGKDDTNSYDAGRNDTTGLFELHGLQAGFLGLALTGVSGTPESFKIVVDSAGATTMTAAGSAPLVTFANAVHVPTASAGTNNTQAASTAFVQAAITEGAQDAVGAMAIDTATIDVTYTDLTPEIKWDVKDDSITYAKIQNVTATDKLLGRVSSGAGDVEEVTCTDFAQSLLDDADAATARLTLKVPSSLFDIIADDTTAGTTVETLASYTVPANTLANNGDKITGYYAGSSGSNANEKEWALLFAGTQIFSTLKAANVRDWNIEFSIIRVSNTTVRCIAKFIASNGDLNPEATYTSITSLALSSTGYNLVLNGTTSDLAGDITLRLGHGSLVPAA